MRCWLPYLLIVCFSLVYAKKFFCQAVCHGPSELREATIIDDSDCMSYAAVESVERHTLPSAILTVHMVGPVISRQHRVHHAIALVLSLVRRC